MGVFLKNNYYPKYFLIIWSKSVKRFHWGPPQVYKGVWGWQWKSRDDKGTLLFLRNTTILVLRVGILKQATLIYYI